MATFKVGQRVKFIGGEPPNSDRSDRVETAPMGSKGVIVSWKWGAAPPDAYAVRFDNTLSSHYSGAFTAYSYQLAPLTDPKADAWAAEQVRKVTKPQHVEPIAPDALRVRAPNTYKVGS